MCCFTGPQVKFAMPSKRILLVVLPPQVVMAGVARRVYGSGLVAGARGRAGNHSGSSIRRKRRCGMGVGLTVLWVGLTVGLAQGYPQASVMGVGLKMIKCPSSMEIAPCTCREMKKGKDLG